MFAANPYQQYKEKSLSTLAPGELLVKLYDELVKQMRLAVLAMDKKDYGLVNASLTKSQTILGVLESSLNMQVPISENLRELYIFIAHQLLKSNVDKSAGPITDCIPLIRDLRDSFEQADKISRKEHAGVAGGRAV